MKSILISSLLFFSGCSIGYDTLQSMDRNRCENIPSPAERHECLSQQRDSYDAYQKYLEKK